MKYIGMENVYFSYDSVDVIQGLNLEIYQGDYMALIGSNGAGKSTLLKLLLGELAVQSGKIEIMGKEISHFKEWYQLGYLPQNQIGMNVSFPANVFEVVATNLYSKVGLGRRLTQAHKERVRDALKSVGMDGFEKRLIGHLSGGQRQRVFLARDMVADPKILILDEPTTGIDDTSVMSFYHLLQKLNQEQGLTIVMVTHDIRRVYPFVSRIACLERSSLVELSKEQISYEIKHSHSHDGIGGCQC